MQELNKQALRARDDQKKKYDPLIIAGRLTGLTLQRHQPSLTEDDFRGTITSDSKG